MLEPSERRLFLESLRPPEGYTFDRAIGTTFTLDLLALMAATLEFARFEQPDDDDGPKADPVALLEAVRRHADHVHLFCERGQISAPPKNRPLLAFLESSVIEVRAPLGGFFHPKVWVLRFRSAREPSESEPICYRVLVLSRNLTFDRCWDTMLALDGELVADRTRGFAMNRPLADFVKALPGMAIRALPATAGASVALVEDELRRVRFSLPPDVDELAFLPLNLKKGDAWPFDKRAERMLVVSPFVSAKLLEQLNGVAANAILVSRLESLAEIEPQVLARFSSVQVINPSAFPEDAEAPATATAEEGAEADAPERSPEDALVGLHAKIFVAEAGWHARMWLGSANATDAAFANNVEFLVELGLKKSKGGIEAVLGSAENSDSLRALLQKYEPPDRPLVDLIEDGLRSAIQKTREALSDAGLWGKVESEQAQEQRFALTLNAALDHELALPPDVTVHVWPATLGEGFSGAPLSSFPKDRTEALGRYTQLSVPELTSFFAVHVVARNERREKHEWFALNVPLEGVPADRREILLKSLLKDRAAMMRYLMFLLAQAGGEGLGAEEVGLFGSGPGRADANATGAAAVPLLEILLQALHRDPSKLEHVERLVDDLSKTEGGRQLLPVGFDEVWQPIRAAWKGATP